MSDKLSRSTYLSRNEGDYPEQAEVFGRQYVRVDNLRYGTNPHQTAALYRPAEGAAAVGDLEILKTGKSGLSQTNLEDISYALNICKFFDRPACACMKHVNPSGAAVSTGDDSVAEVYRKARDGDPRAAFGCVAGFNCEVDEETAIEIMGSFVECVVAPSITDAALAVFADFARFKRNRHLRVVRCGDLSTLPRYVGDAGAETIKVLADGSLVVAQALLTELRTPQDLKRAKASNKASGEQESTAPASAQQIDDLLAAWYINLNVRSNGVVIVKNGGALAVGTGEQDRVGAVEQAVSKMRDKYVGGQSLEGSVMSSDGFFPFPDAIEIAAEAGVTAVIAPSGSLKDADVIARSNELGVALFHAPERIFSHH
jgi:phosphoribosylaminoimidazolecarboxamide formyltransferase/IMP cyclohydrolase